MVDELIMIALLSFAWNNSGRFIEEIVNLATAAIHTQKNRGKIQVSNSKIIMHCAVCPMRKYKKCI